VTLGADQGGSIRVPASWCGVLGLKPTHGLVPYTGAASMDPNLDTIGPMARRVEDLARVLDVIAGFDELDPRQRAGVPVGRYLDAVHGAPGDLGGRRIGVVVEGFEDSMVESESIEAIRAVIERLRELGADVVDLSVPEHLTAGDAAFPIFIEGMRATMSSYGNGYGWSGQYDPDLSLALARGLAYQGDEQPPTLKLMLIVGEYLRQRYGGSFYAKAQNARRDIIAAYDRIMTEVDFLVLPTATVRAHEHDPDAGLAERVGRGWSMLTNTNQFSVAGLPVLSMPAGVADGLPVGMSLVGRRFGEAAMLSLARTYEAAYGWFPQGAPAAGGRQ
jgi:amidase